MNLELLFLLNYHIGNDHLSKLNDNYWHHKFKICRFFVFRIKQFATAYHHFLFETFFFFLPFSFSFFETEENFFIVRSINYIFILDSQPIKGIFSIFRHYFIWRHDRWFEITHKCLSWEARTRNIKISICFLLRDKNFNFVVILLADSIRLKSNFDIYWIIRGNFATCWQITDGSCWVWIFYAFS